MQPLRGPGAGLILRRPASLHELRADAAIQAELVDTPPVRSGFVGPAHQGHGGRPPAQLHRVDEPRPALGGVQFRDGRGHRQPAAGAQALAKGMERDMRGANSWQVSVTADDTLVWTSDAGVLHLQPARGFWQRVGNLFFKLMPASYY
jgi:hypothetical protein